MLPPSPNLPRLSPIIRESPKSDRIFPKKANNWENQLWESSPPQAGSCFPWKKRPWCENAFPSNMSWFHARFPSRSQRLSSAWCWSRGIFCSQIPFVLQHAEKWRKTQPPEPRKGKLFLTGSGRYSMSGEGRFDSLFSFSRDSPNLSFHAQGMFSSSSCEFFLWALGTF